MLEHIEYVGGWEASLDSLGMRLIKKDKNIEVRIKIEKKSLLFDKTTLRIGLSNLIGENDFRVIRNYLCETYKLELPSESAIKCCYKKLLNPFER